MTDKPKPRPPLSPNFVSLRDREQDPVKLFHKYHVRSDGIAQTS